MAKKKHSDCKHPYCDCPSLDLCIKEREDANKAYIEMKNNVNGNTK